MLFIKKEEMEKRALLAVILSLLVLVLWQKLYIAPRQEAWKRQQRIQQEMVKPSPVPESSGQRETASSLSQQAMQSQVISQPAKPEAQEVLVESKLMKVLLTTEGARIKSWQILSHKNSEGNPVELIPELSRKVNRYPLEVLTGDTSLNNELNFGLFTVSKPMLQLTEANKVDSIEFTYKNENGVSFTKRLTFYQDNYQVDVELTLHPPRLETGALFLTWGPGLGNLLDDQTTYSNQIVSSLRGQLLKQPVDKLKGVVQAENVNWAAIDRKYFAAALLPASSINTVAVELLPSDTEEKKAISVDHVILKVGQMGLEGVKYRIYAGPKEHDKLSALKVGLEQLIDYGYYLGWLVKGMVLFMHVVYTYTHSYGLAIISLTVLVKLIFYPLTYVSFKSMKSMQSLQPKVLEIREKYRKDPKVMNQKLMELYKKEGVNPMGGCLPMLLQIPVFFALYQALLVSIELRGASFLWIPDLSAPEPYAIKILVLLMGISMFIQQSMTPTTGDPKQAQMFKFMPIIFTAMFWNFPSGLVLYWLVNNVLSIGQQYLINRGDATGKKAVSDKKRKVNKG